MFYNISLQAEELTNFQKAEQELSKHRFTKANYYYFKVLSKQPKNKEARYGIAHCFLQLRQNNRALTEVNKLLQIDSNHEQGLILRSLINLYDENWEQVLDDAQRVTRVNPLNKQAYLYMDTAYSALGDKEAARLAMEGYHQLKAAQK